MYIKIKLWIGYIVTVLLWHRERKKVCLTSLLKKLTTLNKHQFLCVLIKCNVKFEFFFSFCYLFEHVKSYSVYTLSGTDMIAAEVEPNEAERIRNLDF